MCVLWHLYHSNNVQLYVIGSLTKHKIVSLEEEKKSLILMTYVVMGVYVIVIWHFNKKYMCWVIVYIWWYTALLILQLTTRPLDRLILHSISSSQGAYSMTAHWCTELINIQCHHWYHCLLVWHEEAVAGTCPGPHYGGLSQEFNT